MGSWERCSVRGKGTVDVVNEVSHGDGNVKFIDRELLYKDLERNLDMLPPPPRELENETPDTCNWYHSIARGLPFPYIPK